ncbi:MAG: PHB depolymerase family esterase [Alphaproteobacteria bacterium]
MVNTIPFTSPLSHRISWIKAFSLLSVCFLFICTHRPGHAEVFFDSVDIGHYQRGYIVSIPKGIPPGKRIPAVIALHGPLMSGLSMRRLFGLEEIAKREKFAVIYPNGWRHKWNDGRTMNPTGLDDVHFITRLANRLIKEEVADPRRIYLLGMATGGMLTYRIACEAPETFTAYAAIVANMPKRVVRHCKSKTPVPMLMINSAESREISPRSEISEWHEGRNLVLENSDNMVFWRRNNSCIGKPQVKIMADKDTSDGSIVIAKQYRYCLNNAPVVSFIVDGDGRLPPGMKLPESARLIKELGKPNRDISAADISWKFF